MRPCRPTLAALRTSIFAIILLSFSAPIIAAPPVEIVNLQIQNDKETLTWNAEPLADHYNLYRGYVSQLGTDFYGTVLDAEQVGVSTIDGTLPFTGRAFFYIVTAQNGDGEGPMGDRVDAGGAPAPRTNSHPWSGFDVAGKFEGLRNWPTVAIHSIVLPNGEVLSWKGGAAPTTTYAWDPDSNTFRTTSVSTDLFCSGHSFLPDGRLLAAGGTIPLFNGRDTSWTYDADSATWTQGPGMNAARYYPSLVTEGDGGISALSGNDETGAITPLVEKYTEQGQPRWRVVSGADKTMTLYPALHLLPDGTIFHSGPEVNTETLDTSAGTWTPVATSNYGKRAGNSGQFNSVVVPPSHEEVMIVGGQLPGSTDSTNTVEHIDLSSPTPSWSYIQSMHFPRMHSNATVLPTGEIFVSGGGFDANTMTYPSEIFDPTTGSWTVAYSQRSFRLYHSSVVLLPDGRLLSAGSTVPANNFTAEFYLPPYMFKGPRPVISSSPASVAYGAGFSVESPEAGTIDKVVWIGLSAVTHSKNMGQRYISLAYSSAGTTLSATAPSDPNIAPPGHYLMFIVDTNGVPSEGEFVRIE